MADATETGATPPPWRRWLPLGVVVALLATALALRLDRYLTFDALASNREELLREVARLGPLAPVIYTLSYVAVAALSIPGAVILTLAGGFLFGVVLGSVCIVIGATSGAIIVFLVARSAFGETLRRRAGPFLRKVEAGFAKDAFSYLLVLRLVPLFPFWLVNLAPALLGVRLAPFAAATFIGIIPATIVYAGIGSGLGAVFDRGERPDLSLIFDPKVLLPILGLALLALIPILYRKLRPGPWSEDA